VTQLTVIGTGNMGQAIAGLATKGGHSAELIAHSHTGSAVTGNIVILAVPYPALADVIAVHGESLAGRIVIDITNLLDFQTFDSLTVPSDSSAAAELAAALPRSRVLEAFNTTLAGGTVGPLPTTVLIAGDDTEAKALSGT
jgi:predicted dinucleotide-binding enzyme